MSENTKRPFSRFRTAWKFIRLGLLSLVSRDEIVSHAVDSLADGNTDTTVSEVPTLDELSAMIKAGIDRRTKVICMQEQLFGHEQITQSLAVMRDEIEYDLLYLKIMEFIMKFSYNSNEFLDKILHEEERRFMCLAMSRVKCNTEIFDKFLAECAHNENSSSSEM